MRRAQSVKMVLIRSMDLIGRLCACIVILGAAISALGPVILTLLAR